MSAPRQMALWMTSVSAVWIFQLFMTLARLEDPADALVPFGWAFLAGLVLMTILWWRRRDRFSRPSSHGPVDPSQGPVAATHPGEILARSRSKGALSSVILGGLVAFGVAWFGGLLAVGFFLPAHLAGAWLMWRKASAPSGELSLQPQEGPDL